MPDDEETLAGDLIDSLGITLDLGEGELVVGGAILIKKIDKDGDVTLTCRWSDGISWIEKLGMLRYAEKFESLWIGGDDDD